MRQYSIHAKLDSSGYHFISSASALPSRLLCPHISWSLKYACLVSSMIMNADMKWAQILGGLLLDAGTTSRLFISICDVTLSTTYLLHFNAVLTRLAPKHRNPHIQECSFESPKFLSRSRIGQQVNRKSTADEFKKC